MSLSELEKKEATTLINLHTGVKQAELIYCSKHKPSHYIYVKTVDAKTVLQLFGPNQESIGEPLTIIAATHNAEDAYKPEHPLQRWLDQIDTVLP